MRAVSLSGQFGWRLFSLPLLASQTKLRLTKTRPGTHTNDPDVGPASVDVDVVAVVVVDVVGLKISQFA